MNDRADMAASEYWRGWNDAIAEAGSALTSLDPFVHYGSIIHLGPSIQRQAQQRVMALALRPHARLELPTGPDNAQKQPGDGDHGNG